MIEGAFGFCGFCGSPLLEAGLFRIPHENYEGRYCPECHMHTPPPPGVWGTHLAPDSERWMDELRDRKRAQIVAGWQSGPRPDPNEAGEYD